MQKLFEVVDRDALLSDDGIYRWWLTRKIKYGPGHYPSEPLVGRVVWIMLNPSTADAKIDDRTIRRCMGFAYLWGYEEIVVVNLFALRSTDPKALYKHADPVGPENDRWIKEYTKDAKEIIAAWGAHGTLKGRGLQVRNYLWGLGRPVHRLGLNDDGSPKHPLYLPNDSKRLVLT